MTGIETLRLNGTRSAAIYRTGATTGAAATVTVSWDEGWCDAGSRET
jgi:hypothetical protein